MAQLDHSKPEVRQALDRVNPVLMLAEDDPRGMNAAARKPAGGTGKLCSLVGPVIAAASETTVKQPGRLHGVQQSRVSCKVPPTEPLTLLTEPRASARAGQTAIG